MEPVPVLADLREQVLQRSAKRSPKWGFRFAPDLIIQVQAKPATKVFFEFEALLMPDGAPANAFRGSMSSIKPPHVRLKGIIRSDAPDAWHLRVRRLWRLPQERFDVAAILSARGRMVGGFRPDRWQELTAGHFLNPVCLACGKALTDPASMARFVGPECSGTSTLRVRMKSLFAA
jgi:hypothetical protein